MSQFIEIIDDQQQCLIFSVAAYETVCYGDLGCFTDAPPWGDTDQRPFQILPDDPEDVNTRFYLDTRQQEDVEVFNDGDMDSLL